MEAECLRCGRYGWVNMHHRKLRSQGGDDSEANLIPLCVDCHLTVHAHPGQSYGEGWMVQSWNDPAEVALPTFFSPDVENHAHPEPGEKCPTCERRVPHKKKPTSPKTKVKGVRIPIDDVETFKEILDAAAEHAGLLKAPHHEYHAILRGLVLLLQEPGNG